MGDVIAKMRLYESRWDVRLLEIVVWRGARDWMAVVFLYTQDGRSCNFYNQDCTLIAYARVRPTRRATPSFTSNTPPPLLKTGDKEL
jgi:hypothetical protein